jgi:uncharacterized C2H2 Zn-finger protein
MTNEYEYDFPYNGLVELVFAHGQGTMHIPLPFFSKKERIEFALNIPISEKIRDGEFFTCPACGDKSFYAGMCGTCDCAYVVPTLANINHEALKRATKTEFLRRLDSGASLGIKSACIILADGDDNDHWNIPYSNKPIAEIHSDIYKIIDKWIDEGKVEPFIRLDEYRKLLHIPRSDFGDPVQDLIYELEEELGYRVYESDIPFIIGDKNTYEKCHRCGKITRDVMIVNHHYLCRECCHEDPVAVIDDVAIEINYDLTGSISSDYLDPDTLEEVTDFMEVPYEVFNPMFKGHVKRIIIHDASQGKRRYFVYPPNLMPEYKQVFEPEEVEWEVIEVEGSDELRIQVNGVWQHKHEGYYYWHPIARIHK